MKKQVKFNTIIALSLSVVTFLSACQGVEIPTDLKDLSIDKSEQVKTTEQKPSFNIAGCWSITEEGVEPYKALIIESNNKLIYHSVGGGFFSFPVIKEAIEKGTFDFSNIKDAEKDALTKAQQASVIRVEGEKVSLNIGGKVQEGQINNDDKFEIGPSKFQKTSCKEFNSILPPPLPPLPKGFVDHQTKILFLGKHFNFIPNLLLERSRYA